jgi:DnaA family protein
MSCDTAELAQLPLPFPLEPSARFETYVAGENGALLAHLRSFSAGVASATGPLWLWGEPGCGRSHLLQASCATGMLGKAMYVPLAELPAPDRLEGLDSLAFVALDDVDVVVGDPAWDRALFGLFNAVQSGGVRLLCAARCAPGGLNFSLPDLSSRASGAIVYHIRSLSDENLIVALQVHARFRGVELPEPSARFLLHRAHRGMGALCQWIDRLDRASLAAQRKLTIPFIRAHLA